MSGVAPVKAEYRVQVSKHPPKEAAQPDDGTSSEAAPSQPVRKRQRGLNKAREQYRPPAGNKLCNAIAEGRACTFGESCRFSHDLAACYACRPPDLGETCPIFTLRGFCRFGVNCRFGSCHLGPDGTNLGTPFDPPPPGEINIMSHAVSTQLRKGQYPLDRANAVAARISAEMVKLHETHQANQQRRSQAPAPAEDGAATSAAAAATETPAADAERSSPADGGERVASSDGVERVEKKEKKAVDFRGKLYLAPLTTVGNLPFRRVCKGLGADITCGEMAMATNLLQGQASEWALLKRHPCEDVFGVQIAGSAIDAMGRTAQLIDEMCDVDFVDINMGCPIDVVCNRGCGSALAVRPTRVQGIVRTMSELLSCPLTVKMRKGYATDTPTAHNMIPKLHSWGAAAVTLHGRSRQQRYTKSADWQYITRCAALTQLPFIGNGDVFSYEHTNTLLLADAAGGADGGLAPADAAGADSLAPSPVSSLMLARGALVKPWLFTELKERRHWDIRSSERLELLRTFTRYGLEHWGTDELGVAKVRNFMLEWLSFLHRYVPIGLLERMPPRLQDRPPAFVGRDELETLMASPSSADWVKITELLLGKVPETFSFTPKHKANAYESGPILAEG